MTLDYPSAAAVAAGVRLRMTAHSADVPILIVEGKTDRATLIKIIRPEVVVVWATNKEKALGARAFLNEQELDRCTFLVDCDGDLSAPWRSTSEVIISDQRDLDADAALVLGALSAVVRDYFAYQHSSGVELETHVRQVTRFIAQTTALCGAVTDTARSLSAPVRIELRSRRGTLERRRVRPDDLHEFVPWANDLRVPDLYGEMLPSVSARLGWNLNLESQVESALRVAARKNCRIHSRAGCVLCLSRTFANGHDLTAVLSRVILLKLSLTIGERDLARHLRLAIDLRDVTKWRVMRRLVARGEATGLVYVTGPI